MGLKSLDEEPMVSVLMTAFNREKYIAEAIESILASDYINFELIIVDDCSSDRTVEVARSFEERDERVIVFVNEKNLGQFKNRNKAASYAKGKYLKYFDSDDVLYSHSLSVMVDSMEQYTDAGAGIMCYSKEFIGKTPYLFFSRDCYINHYFKGNTLLTVGPSGIIFRRDIFEKMGRFAENAGILSDSLLMLQIAAIKPILGLENNLFYWRIHDEQVTEDQKKVYEMLIEREKINQTVLNSPDCPLTIDEIEIVKRNLKNIFIRNLPRLITKMSLRNTIDVLNKFEINFSHFFFAFLKNKKVQE